jgi:2-oxoglutarate ferredoxin oxidoreductase subunit delta
MTGNPTPDRGTNTPGHAIHTPDRGKVEINAEECKGCGLCVEACPPKVLHLATRLNPYGYHPAEYQGSGCTGCGICFYVCPEPGGIAVLRLTPKTAAA